MSTKFMSALMSEFISYGGMAATREEVYKDALDVALSNGRTRNEAERSADLFAFGPNAIALTPEQVATRLRFDPVTREPVKGQP